LLTTGFIYSSSRPDPSGFSIAKRAAQLETRNNISANLSQIRQPFMERALDDAAELPVDYGNGPSPLRFRSLLMNSQLSDLVPDNSLGESVKGKRPQPA